VLVERAFAFVDLCGFTSFTEVHGVDDAVALLAEFRATVRETASRRGIRVAKWLGDGAMFVSVETDLMLPAVLEIEQHFDERKAPLALRAGVTCGEAILFEGDDYIGFPVNLASRLCDAAENHGVLATPEAVRDVPPWAVVEPIGELDVIGLSRPVKVVRLFTREHGEAVIDPICRMELPPDGVVTTRSDGDREVAFCSTSCASVWDQRRRIS
jgi:adenylate cyclase